MTDDDRRIMKKASGQLAETLARAGTPQEQAQRILTRFERGWRQMVAERDADELPSS